MRLKEALKKVITKYVKVGSHTAFMYCGVPDEAEIARVSEEERIKLTAEISNKLKKLSELDSVIADIVSRIATKQIRSYKDRNGEFSDKSADTIAIYTRRQVKYEFAKLLEKELYAIGRVKDRAKDLTPWVALLDREVKETYRSDAEPDTTIIIIDGSEKGLYWTVEEYQRGIGAEDDDDEEDV